MSNIYDVRIKGVVCDNPCKNRQTFDPTYSSYTATLEAKVRGWTHIDGHDLCPACSKKEASDETR